MAHRDASNEVFDLREFPRRLVVVGGGYIACEFASIFHGLGAEVTQLYRGEQMLRGFDDDVRAFLADEMRKKGVDLRTHAHVERIDRAARRAARGAARRQRARRRQVLYATGRNPNTAGLGLAEASAWRSTATARWSSTRPTAATCPTSSPSAT